MVTLSSNSVKQQHTGSNSVRQQCEATVWSKSVKASGN